MIISRRNLAAGLCAGSLAPLLTTRRARSASLEKVTVGSINATSDAGVFLADEFGYARDEGLAIELITIQDAPAIIAAVATSQLDVGGLSVTPGLFTAPQQGINLRIVGDKQSFSKGFGSTKLLVRKAAMKATEKETVEALKGKTVAVNSKGAITYYFMAKLLEKHGVKLSDVRIMELSYPNIGIALTNGSIDVGTLIEPFVTKTLQAGSTELIGGDLLEFVPGGQMSVTPLVYSEKMRDKKDMANAFMRAYLRGVRAYNDAFRKGIRKDEVIAIIAKRTKVSPDLVRDTFPPGLDPNQRLNVEAFNAIESFYASQGLVRNTIDAAKIVDDSFAKAAVAKLGEYKA